MVAPVIALSLVGLGTVQALPASKTFEERQAPWFGFPGGSGSSFSWGTGTPLPTCVIDVPITQQSPCVFFPITGGFNPGKERRQASSTLGSSTSPSGEQAAIAALELQLLELQNKPNPTADDLAQIAALQAMIQYTEGITSISAPPGVGSTLTHGRKKRFTLPPDYNSNTKHAIEELELELEKLQNKNDKTPDDYAEIDDIKAALNYLVGITNISAPPGTGTTFTPGKTKRFTLPPDASSDPKRAIDELERALENLENKKHKTEEDRQEIRDIKEALKYLAGITSISAPPGTGSTLTPGRMAKRFTLPPDANTDVKKAIEELEKELEDLENKKHKTEEDRQEIRDIKDALKYLAGIASISAPQGGSTTFTPGKRQEFGLGSVGSYSSECPDIAGAELALEGLMHMANPTVEEYIAIQKLKHFLNGCGVTSIQSPDGTSTIIKPSDKKRDTSPFRLPTNTVPGFDLTGLEKAYEALSQSLGTSKPSFATWLALQHLADLLQLFGITIDRSPVGTTTTLVPGKRQTSAGSGTITIGTQACQLADILGLKAALAALETAYGDPSHAPQNVFLAEQVIVSALQLCGQPVAGWTTLTPGNPVPGGAVTPDPVQPGGPIKPPTKARQAPVSDPSALLAALTLLEQKYGNYGSGTIPVPVFLIMEGMVTILQDIPGVTVPGWPILGQGSVTLKPST